MTLVKTWSRKRKTKVKPKRNTSPWWSGWWGWGKEEELFMLPFKNLRYLHHSADFGVKGTHFVPTLHRVTWWSVGWRGPLNTRQENADQILQQISIHVVVHKSAKNRYIKTELRHSCYIDSMFLKKCSCWIKEY